VLPVLDLCPTFLTTRAVAEQIAKEATLAVDASVGDGLVYGDGFEIETVLFLRAARNGLRIAEVPSCEAPRHMGTSNLRTVRDGTRVLGAIARERTRRATAFAASAAGATAVRPTEG